MENNTKRLMIGGAIGIVTGTPLMIATNLALATTTVVAVKMALVTAWVFATVGVLGGAAALGSGFVRGLQEGFKTSNPAIEPTVIDPPIN